MKSRGVVILTHSSIVAAGVRRSGRKAAVQSFSRETADVPVWLDDEFDLAPLAAMLVEAIQAQGLSSVTLIIPASWCFTHTIEAKRRRFKHDAACYELEAFLPVSLEEVVCAFQVVRERDALGIALPVKPTASLIRKLTSNGIEVDNIVPDLMCATRTTENAGISGVLLRDECRRSLAIVGDDGCAKACRNGIFDHHHHLSNAIVNLEEYTDAQPAIWHTVDLQFDRDCERLVEASLDRRTPEFSADRFAPSILRPRVASELTRLAAAVALFLTCAIVCMHIQRGRLEKSNDQMRLHMAAIYSDTLPGRTVPPNPSVRLASERIRLERLTREDSDDGPTKSRLHDDRLAPFSVMKGVAAALPDALRINLLEITIDDHQVLLRGQTRNHAEAERIADAVNHLERFTVRAPRTSRIPTGGVDFTVRALPDTRDTHALAFTGDSAP